MVTRVNLAKYQGAGNDFVIIDLKELARILPIQEWPNFAEHVCDRHFGIGADGLLVAGRPDRSEEFGNVSMVIFNPDGSQAEMCGNGVRCVADYSMKLGWPQGLTFIIDTDAGPKQVEMVQPGVYKVNMGPPNFDPLAIPVKDHQGEGPGSIPTVWVRDSIEEPSPYLCVSMGNPHAVTLVQDVDDIELEVLGPRVEHDSHFPQMTNVEIVQIVDQNNVKVLVWERGAGATLACGTGACAAVAVLMKTGENIASPVQVELPGGTLTVDWDGEGDVFLTGPATRVAEVEYNYKG